jgi:hypothetical protein
MIAVPTTAKTSVTPMALTCSIHSDFPTMEARLVLRWGGDEHHAVGSWRFVGHGHARYACGRAAASFAFHAARFGSIRTQKQSYLRFVHDAAGQSAEAQWFTSSFY